MKFKIHKVNVAPLASGLEDWKVSIELSTFSSDDEGRIIIGSSCRSKEELAAQIESTIDDLRKLKFPQARQSRGE
jgi:hypothetical protein